MTTLSDINKLRKLRMPEESSVGASQSSKSVDEENAFLGLLPTGFTPLGKLKGDRQLHNFVGVVTDITTPRKSRGSDHYCKIFVTDPLFSSGSREVMWFASPPFFPNVYRGGEIVVFRSVKCTTYQGELQLVKNKSTSITVVPRDDDPPMMQRAR